MQTIPAPRHVWPTMSQQAMLNCSLFSRSWSRHISTPQPTSMTAQCTTERSTGRLPLSINLPTQLQATSLTRSKTSSMLSSLVHLWLRSLIPTPIKSTSRTYSKGRTTIPSSTISPLIRALRRHASSGRAHLSLTSSLKWVVFSSSYLSYLGSLCPATSSLSKRPSCSGTYTEKRKSLVAKKTATMINYMIAKGKKGPRRYSRRRWRRERNSLSTTASMYCSDVAAVSLSASSSAAAPSHGLARRTRASISSKLPKPASWTKKTSKRCSRWTESRLLSIKYVSRLDSDARLTILSVSSSHTRISLLLRSRRRRRRTRKTNPGTVSLKAWSTWVLTSSLRDSIH